MPFTYVSDHTPVTSVAAASIVLPVPCICRILFNYTFQIIADSSLICMDRCCTEKEAVIWSYGLEQALVCPGRSSAELAAPVVSVPVGESTDHFISVL